MSDLNTAASPAATAATEAPTATAATTKPGKSKGLSIFNRVTFIVAALLAVLTIAMLVATASRPVRSSPPTGARRSHPRMSRSSTTYVSSTSA